MLFRVFLYIFLFIFTFLNFYYSINIKIKERAVNAINSAEDTEKSGEEKMYFAVCYLRKTIPFFARFLFRWEKIEKIVQEVFEKMEDYSKKQFFKDGNMNGN